MVVVAPETPPQVDLVDLARTVLASALAGLWQAVADTPVLGVLLVAVVLAGAVRSARRAIYGGWERDPVRRFSRADRAVILARAGHRCEHHVLIFGRCRAETDLQADHIHPWARGGATALGNGQALCKRHNQEKRASVPFDRQLRRIEARRADYFPSGVTTAVRRRHETTVHTAASPLSATRGRSATRRRPADR